MSDSPTGRTAQLLACGGGGPARRSIAVVSARGHECVGSSRVSRGVRCRVVALDWSWRSRRTARVSGVPHWRLWRDAFTDTPSRLSAEDTGCANSWEPQRQHWKWQPMCAFERCSSDSHGTAGNDNSDARRSRAEPQVPRARLEPHHIFYTWRR